MTTLSDHLAARAAVDACVAEHLTAIQTRIAQAQADDLYPDGLTAVLQQVFDLSRYALRRLPALPVEDPEDQPEEGE